MPTSSRFLSLSCLCLIAGLVGCSGLPGGSPASHTSRGGFTVMVDGPGLPASSVVAADIGAFAQRRGFVRQPGAAGQDRYVGGEIILEVTRQPDQHRVSAYLHNNGGANEDKAIARFYREFAQENDARYGTGHISETAYADDRDRGTSMFGKPVETNQTSGRGFGNGT